MKHRHSSCACARGHYVSGTLRVLCPALLFVSSTVAYRGFAQTPGSLDTSFQKGAGPDGFLRVVAVQPDGGILAGGNFTEVRGRTNALIARLNPDGSADSAFTSPFPLPVLNTRIYTIGLETNGRLVVGGLFTNVSGTFRTNIARLQADGSLDKSFDAGAGPAGLVRIVALQPDGRIILGGEFTTVNQTNRNRIARLNSDGSLDTSFDPGAGANDIVRSVALLASGKILVGGLFTAFDGQPAPYLARLNSNGSLDASFPVGGGPNGAVYFIAPQTDGTLFIGGEFTSVNGVSSSGVAHLKADGSVDSLFAPGNSVQGGPVYHVIRQTNGRIVIGGGFTSVKGATANRLARLNSDGSPDSTFNIGTGPSDLVLSLAIEADGKLLAGGLFGTYNGTTVGPLARIYGDTPLPSVTVGPFDSGNVLISWPAWASGYGLQATSQLVPASWQAVTNGVTLQGDSQTVSTPTSAPAQFYRLVAQ